MIPFVLLVKLRGTYLAGLDVRRLVPSVARQPGKGER